MGRDTHHTDPLLDWNLDKRHSRDPPFFSDRAGPSVRDRLCEAPFRWEVRDASLRPADRGAGDSNDDGADLGHHPLTTPWSVPMFPLQLSSNCSACFSRWNVSWRRREPTGTEIVRGYGFAEWIDWNIVCMLCLS